MKLALASSSTHWANCFALLSMGLVSCTPAPSTNLAPAMDNSLELVAPQSNDPQQQVTQPTRPPKPYCGLPQEIREDFWPRVLSPTQSQDPSPPHADAVTLVVLPDTQYYASCKERHLAQQTRYVDTLSQERTVAATIFLGDLTDHNTSEEWSYLQDALDLLPASVPTVLATGNHDYGHDGTADSRATLFSRVLKPPQASTISSILAQMEAGRFDNVLYRVKAGGFTLSVLALEWSPRNATVDWARRILKQFPDERLIFVTHAYMYYDDTRYDFTKYGEEQKWNPIVYGTAKRDPLGQAGGENLSPDGAWDAQMLWDGLLRDYPGLFLTLSGHVLGDGSARLSSRGTQGNLVHQVLTNFQMLDEGGLGYLRQVEIDPEGSSMQMKTYSPSLGQYALAHDQYFSLEIEPPLL